MAESRIVDRLGSKVAERESYQPFIIGVPYRHTVRAASTSREIVLIARISGIGRVLDAYGARRELVRIKRKWIGWMADSHSKSKRRQHGFEMNGELAAIGEEVGVCYVGWTERTRHTPSLICNAYRSLCPTLGTEQRNREGEKRDHAFRHGWDLLMCLFMRVSRGTGKRGLEVYKYSYPSEPVNAQFAY